MRYIKGDGKNKQTFFYLFVQAETTGRQIPDMILLIQDLIVF